MMISVHAGGERMYGNGKVPSTRCDGLKKYLLRWKNYVVERGSYELFS